MTDKCLNEDPGPKFLIECDPENKQIYLHTNALGLAEFVQLIDISMCGEGKEGYSTWLKYGRKSTQILILIDTYSDQHMPSFDDAFKGFRKEPVIYKEKKLYRIDRLDIPKKCSVLIRFVSTNSEWKQGIRLNVDGNFVFSGERLGKKLIFWEDTAPPDTVVDVISKDGTLWIYNAWDTGNGSTDARHNGAAMIIEDMPNGRRYFCNDGHPDENFDDIVFEVVVLDE